MNLKKCLKGHLFDSDKYTNCPYCGAVQWRKELLDPEPKTRQPWEDTATDNQGDGIGNGQGNIKPGGIYDKNDSNSTVLLEVPKEEYTVCLNCKKKNLLIAKFCEACGKPLVKTEQTASKHNEKTIAEQFMAVVGWLVGVRGVYFGKSFPIRPGRNSIGKSEKSAIRLDKDTHVIEANLAWLTFDPKKNIYYIQPGEGSGLVYINNEIVLTAKLLIPRDRIEIGDGEYIFIPLCDSEFKWSDYIKGSTN